LESTSDSASIIDRRQDLWVGHMALKRMDNVGIVVD